MEWERDFEHCSNILILLITRDNDAEPADRMGCSQNFQTKPDGFSQFAPAT